MSSQGCEQRRFGSLNEAERNGNGMDIELPPKENISQDDSTNAECTSKNTVTDLDDQGHIYFEYV